MTHLNERITEFLFEELSPVEMAEATRHLAGCAECRLQVEQMQRTYAMLRTSPDAEPPRSIVFEVEKPRFVPWVWRWLAPMAAAAAVAMAVVTFAPAARSVERVVVQQQQVSQPVDYERIVSELRVSQEAWLANELKNELKKGAAAQSKELQQLRNQVAYTEILQRAMWNYTIDNASSIQLLAQKGESGN